MADAVIADSISYLPEFKAWYGVLVNGLAEFDESELLVYLVDTVDASLIPALATQFDVLGYKGMRLAQTEDDQRSLLKTAIYLHRFKGTEWAIMQALLSIGFADIRLKKGIADGYDHWAEFGIEITNSSIQLTDESLNDIIQMVTEYKRQVCVLMDVSMTILVEDVLDMQDDEANARPGIVIDDDLFLTGTLKYDGDGLYDGTYDHSGDSDIVTITQQ